jgi:osmotically-inducible protein OsmY
MRHLLAKLGGLAAGALAMYYLDPQMGAERRDALRRLVAGGWQDAKDRAPRGRIARRAYHRIAMADPQRDAELRDQIRGRLDRLVSHPRAVQVDVSHGVVRLSGHVLAKERDGLLLHVRELPGVQKLVNAMTAHDTPQGLAEVEAREAERDGARLAA